LIPNTIYYVAVKAEGSTDTYDSPYTNCATCITLLNPSFITPTNLTCISSSPTSITLNWTCPSIISNLVGFTISCNTTATQLGSSYTWVDGILTTSYIITGLNPNTTYHFAIKSEGLVDAYDSPFTSFVSCSTNPSGSSATPAPTN